MYSVTEAGVLKKIETWQVTIPLHDNSGVAFEDDVIESILNHITLNFPGLTVVNCTGRWRKNERTYKDKNLQVLVDALPMSTEESSSFFSDLKSDLQARLKQEKIYITKESAKQEMLSFEEFFDEIGMEAKLVSRDSAKTRGLAQQIVNRFDFVMQRLGYETISIRRDRKEKKIIWERRLCGIRLLSVLDDPFPDEAVIFALDQIESVAQHLFSNSCVVLGHYEYQQYAVHNVPIKPFVRSTINVTPDFQCPQYLSPEDDRLSVRQFVERFTMGVVTNLVVLRDHGFFPTEIEILVGSDGSLQTTNGKLGRYVFYNPADIPDEPVKKEIIRCVRECCDMLDEGTLDPFSLQQAKAMNRYILKRAFLKRCPPMPEDSGEG